MPIFKDYLNSLLEIKKSGMAVPETSYYGALELLLNEVGKLISPNVRAIINIKNTGAGIPDGGFFTLDQFANEDEDLLTFRGTMPSRGAIEIKGTEFSIEKLIESEQAKRYINSYGLLLVTNYYEFALLSKDPNGTDGFLVLEEFNLSTDEESFWKTNSTNQIDIIRIEVEFLDFLKRCMVYNAPLFEPQDVAWFLASYAKKAMRVIKDKEFKSLESFRSALQGMLNIEFEGEEGNHAFESTLVQTIFYGVFSAFVLFHSSPSNKKSAFSWRLAGWYLKVPMIKVLFDQLMNPTQIGKLEIEDILDLTQITLNRIDVNTFFDRFSKEDAIMYFYEPFLTEFDEELRKELGIWYTPKEVVKYMVDNVDRRLKENLNLKLGLADSSVVILDPCCGTGAYLLECVKKIHENLIFDGRDALLLDDLKEAILNRIYGFELLPASFIIAHLQLNLYLNSIGIEFEYGTERPPIYLTNSLTGWNLVSNDLGKSQIKIGYPELIEEKKAADKVKQTKPVMVFIGNPPYNAFAGAKYKEEENLIEDYKIGLKSDWNIGKYNLDDLYIRFMRIAEEKLSEYTKIGIISYITNFSYLYEPSFVVMRKHLLNNFNEIYIDSLNGDSRETGKKTPEGLPDPSIFSTKYNKSGIRKGTAIGTFIIEGDSDRMCEVNFRDLWGKDKRERLTSDFGKEEYLKLLPTKNNRFLLRNVAVNPRYYSWKNVVDIANSKDYPTFMESRGGCFIDISREILRERMIAYYNHSIEFSELITSYPEFKKNFSGYDSEKIRAKVIASATEFDEENIVEYLYKPFDFRYAYLPKINKFWHRSRPELNEQYTTENSFFVTRLSSEKVIKGSPFYLTSARVDCQALARNASVFPLMYNEGKEFSKGELISLFDPIEVAKQSPNVNAEICNKYVHELDKLEGIWYHILTIGYSRRYLDDNKDGIKYDYPRIPLDSNIITMEKSINIGKRIKSILNIETSEYEKIFGRNNLFKLVETTGRVALEDRFKVLSNWGRLSNGSVMPGKGRYKLKKYDDVILEDSSNKLTRCVFRKL